MDGSGAWYTVGRTSSNSPARQESGRAAAAGCPPGPERVMEEAAPHHAIRGQPARAGACRGGAVGVRLYYLSVQAQRLEK